MRLRLIAVGSRVPAWVEAGFADYAERLPRELPLELVEIATAARGTKPDIARLREAEGRKMLRALGPQALVIALDERGDRLDTAAWAAHLKTWLQTQREVCLLVGGPDGLAPDCLARAQARWSLSPLTFPHALVRVVVAEQLYRAWSLLEGHPYHRP